MSLLLDTHSFLWFVLSDLQLPDSARRVIESSSASVYVSPVSYWEIAIKISSGKYALCEPFERFWQTGIGVSKFSVLPISIEHAGRVATLPFYYRDPFDRMLVAQALAGDLTLVSRDARLDAYGVRRVW